MKILILGDSGTGKSASLRNFGSNEVLVINCAGKPLPFRNVFESVTPSYETMTKDVLTAMSNTKKKVIVIDDAQYIMSFQYMRRIKENGWDKWNDIQSDFFRIIQHCDDLPSDTIVYFLSHIQRDDEGHEKIKTMGKMLDEKITLEGLFSIVLKTRVVDGQYVFATQNNGFDTVKSPIGMFNSPVIENDLKFVDDKIREYYGLADIDRSELEKKEKDLTVDVPSDVPEVNTQRRTRRKKDTEQTEEIKPSEDITDAETTEQTVEQATETTENPKRRRRIRKDDLDKIEELEVPFI